jgi:hypothetical protein
MRFLTRLTLFIVAVGVADPQFLLGQQQAPAGGRQGGPAAGGRGRGGAPPPDAVRPARGRSMTNGTASIRGRVINATTGSAVRRAAITATYVNEQNGRSEGGRSGQTDDNGAFEIRDMPAGRWTLRASKTGFIDQQFGQRSAFAETDPIVLADGQRFVADFRLARGGAISGRIIDEFGDPVAGANVSALRIQTTAQGIRTTRAGTTVPSDDTGAYRVYGLPPGQYYVSANDPRARIVVSLFEAVLTEAVQAEVSSIQSSFGVSRDVARESASYAPTYYPGTASRADAQRISLNASEEQSGINITIVPVRAARITGRVTGSNGAPLQAAISLVGQWGQTFNAGGGRNGSGGDGSFTLNNIPPGSYRLNVLGPSVGTAPPEVASMPLVVDGNDILGLTLVTGSGGTVQGSLTSDNGTKLPAARIRVIAEPVERGPATFMPRAEVNANGSFELEGLLGIYTLRFEALPAGWTIKGVTANGVDVADTAVEFRAGDRISMRVELTDRVSQVTGTVRSDRPVTSATVVIFADDPSKWTGASRFVKTARLSNGQFTVSALPPHPRYLAIAVDYVEPGESQTVEFLQRARAAASATFGLAAGEQRVIDLPLIVR